MTSEYFCWLFINIPTRHNFVDNAADKQVFIYGCISKKVNFLTPEENISKMVSKVRVFNEENKVKYINLIDEKILTIYLNSQEVLTALTICDYPEYLAVGFSI